MPPVCFEPMPGVTPSAELPLEGVGRASRAQGLSLASCQMPAVLALRWSGDPMRRLDDEEAHKDECCLRAEAAPR